MTNFHTRMSASIYWVLGILAGVAMSLSATIAVAWDTTGSSSYGAGTSIRIGDGCSLIHFASFNPTSSSKFSGSTRLQNNSGGTGPVKYSGGGALDSDGNFVDHSASAITQADIEGCGFTGVNIIRNQAPAATFAETTEMGLEFTAIRYGVTWRYTATAIGPVDGELVHTLTEAREGAEYPYVVIQDQSDWSFIPNFGAEGDAWQFRLSVNNADGTDTVCINDFLCSGTASGEGFFLDDVSVTGVSGAPSGRDIFSWDNSGGATVNGVKSVLATISAAYITGPVTVQVKGSSFRGEISNELNVQSSVVSFTPPIGTPSVTLTDFVPVTDEHGNITRLTTNMSVDRDFLFNDDNVSLSLGTLIANSDSSLDTSGRGVNPAGTYELHVTPTAEGDITLNTGTAVYDGRGSDVGVAAASNTVVYSFTDTSRPVITLEDVTKSGSNYIFAVSGTEEITNVEASDFDITGGATLAYLFASGGKHYMRIVNPFPENTSLTFTAKAGSIEDLRGNTNENASNTITFELDTIKPGLTLSDFVLEPATGLIKSTLSSTEAVRFDPELGDLTVENGTATEVSAVLSDGKSWEISVRPTVTGNVTLEVPAGRLFDTSNNLNTASNQISYAFSDTIAPVVSLDAFTPQTISGIDYFYTDIRIVNGVGGSPEDAVFGNDYVTLTGATSAGQSRTDLGVYRYYVLPEGGPISMFVKAGTVDDQSGNSNVDPSNTINTTYTDTTPPSITLGALAQQANGSYTSAVTISETVTNFTVEDLSLTNASATLTGSDKSYTVTLTPAALGEVRLSVAAGTFTDSSNNANTASNEVTATFVDTFAPSISLGELTAQGGGVFTSAITISESVTNFTADDLTLNNATATLSGSGASYTATLTSTTPDGTISLSVGAATFSDASNNDNTASNTVMVEYDSTPPTVTIAALVGPSGGSYTAAITLSEAVQSFETSDLTLTNASAALTGSGTSFTATLTPSADGRVALSVAKDALQDVSGNRNAASNEVEATYDTTGPTVTIAELVRSGQTYTATVTLSEAVSSFAASNFTVVNGSVALSGSGTSYSIVLTPAAEGAVSLHVAAEELEDAVGNKSTISNTVTANYVEIIPVATLADPTGPANGTFSMGITLNAASTNFVADDITVTNGSVTQLTGSGTSYTATITPASDGALSAVVNANTFTDEFNTDNVVSNSVNWSYDGTPPTVVISALSGPSNGTFSATITISENTTDFTKDDLTLANATAVLSGSGANYSVVLSPATDGDVVISVEANKLTDAAGNGNTASNQVSANYDTTPPTITIAALAGPTNGTYTASITISEDTSDFALEDLTLTNATASLTGSGSAYSAVLTPVSDGDIALSVKESVFSDAAGNANTASNEVTAVFDTTPPTVTVAAFQGPANGQRTALITTSEETVNFVASDLAVSNLTVNSLVDQGDNRNFLATVTPISDGAFNLSVAAGVFTDAAGNGNTASNAVNGTHDGTAPSLTITASVTESSGQTPFTATFTFSENVTGFALDDITVANGTATNFAGGNDTYTATITPTGDGDITISVAQSLTSDAAGNLNTASNTLEVENNTVEVTQEVVKDYINSRASNLIANQPIMTNFMTTGVGGGFNADVTRGRGVMDFQTDADSNAWFRGKLAWSEIGAETTRYAHTAFGYHEFLNDNLMVGAMVQVDYAKATAATSTTEGTGWFVGPYVVTKHPVQPLYFEASALIGRSQNNVSPLGTYTDQYTSDRVMLTGRVTGEIAMDQITWRPNAALSYSSDNTHTYTDTLGNIVPGQKVAFTEFSFGAEFARPLDVWRGDFMLTGGFSGRFNSTEGLSAGQQVVHENTRMRLDLGFDYLSPNDVRTAVTTYYDGLFAENFESVGIQLRVDWSF